MTNIYDYQANIKVTTTLNGDKVITMNNAIFDELLNDIFDAKMYQESKNLSATARDTVALWRALAGEDEQ
jgi:hypothetical protein